MVTQSSLDDINIRRVVDHIRKSVSQILQYYMFEFKDDILADTIKKQLTPYFEQLLEKRAIQTYKTEVYVNGEDLSELDKRDQIIEILKRENEKGDVLHVNIQIQPIKTVECVEVKFTV